MLKVDEGNLKQGVLALAIAIVEVIERALGGQAIRRMDAGALMDLEEAIVQITTSRSPSRNCAVASTMSSTMSSTSS